ncbi:hypothetical protein OH687_05190 [Burkholderia anthina]|nr:hypothetical protein OH687_05190 [Burkholderia anthina]
MTIHYTNSLCESIDESVACNGGRRTSRGGGQNRGRTFRRDRARK